MYSNATLKVSLIGLRSLPEKVKQLNCKIELVGNHEWPVTKEDRKQWKQKQADIEGQDDKDPTVVEKVCQFQGQKIGNFDGEIIEFKKVNFAYEPLLWPYLKITFSKEGYFSESSFSVTLPLFKYAKWSSKEYIEENEKLFNFTQDKVDQAVIPIA